MSSPEEERALDLLLASIAKKEKDPNLINHAETKEHAIVQVDVISTGSLGVDVALMVGGVARGRITEIMGDEQVGKSTMCLQTIANAQKRGLRGAYVDAEHAIDLNYARALGVDTTAMILSQPDNGSQAMRIVKDLVTSGLFGVVIVDSVASLIPEDELKKEISDANVGGLARLMSQGLKQLAPLVRKSNTALIFVNQIRFKIGVMFGNPETTPGGQALKHYTSMRINLRRHMSVNVANDDGLVANEVVAKIIKNKLGMPGRSATYMVYYGQGIDQAGEVITLGLKHDLIQQAGAWFSCQGERIGQGRDKARVYLLEHPELYDDLRRQILDLTAVGQVVVELPEEAAEA